MPTIKINAGSPSTTSFRVEMEAQLQVLFDAKIVAIFTLKPGDMISTKDSCVRVNGIELRF